MKTVIYGRVSTSRQEFDSQIQELQDICRRRGWKNPEIITDRVSGGSFTRSGLDRLMKSIRTGKTDRVLCFKLDRLGRSLAHLAQLVEEFMIHSVALVIPNQGIDTSESNPASKFQLDILMAVAAFERATIRERVNAGLKAAKRRGVKLGRPVLVRRKQQQEVLRLRAENISIRKISEEVGLPSSTVHRIVRPLS